MLDFKIDLEKLEKEINELTDWDDWGGIEKEIFRTDDWPEISLDALERDLERPTQIIAGSEWGSTTNSYDVSPEILHLYEKTRERVFAKLEPEADEENKKHTELFGKRCLYCRIWTRSFSKKNCPICRNELLKMPLNEWD